MITRKKKNNTKTDSGSKQVAEAILPVCARAVRAIAAHA